MCSNFQILKRWAPVVGVEHGARVRGERGLPARARVARARHPVAHGGAARHIPPVT